MKFAEFIAMMLYKKRCITEYIKHDLLKIKYDCEEELEKK